MVIPFFLDEALRHVEESGGRLDPAPCLGSSGSREPQASRLPAETNKALAGGRGRWQPFCLALVESVVGEDLIDASTKRPRRWGVIEGTWRSLPVQPRHRPASLPRKLASVAAYAAASEDRRDTRDTTGRG